MTSRNDPAVVAGIDVGGSKKGFHGVALRQDHILDTLATRRAADAVAWCRAQRVVVVGVDAPCRWSPTGRARSCERELAGLGLSCFATPSQATGEVHPFYRWMVNGAELYRLLARQYRLYDGTRRCEHLCFETFPQAIACSLAGNMLSARHKRVDRRRLLEQAGLFTGQLTSLDAIDAALCALTARHVLAGRFNAYGDSVEGFILLPHCCFTP
jgi:predicted nuclease with RNAse H fold